MITYSTILLTSMLVGPRAQTVEARQQPWPQVSALLTTVFFANASEAHAIVVITERRTGRPLYRVECHPGGYDRDSTFDYSGDFECRLVSLYATSVYSTLFTENPAQSRDWESRARFLADQLIDGCADYPEYGRIRHFRVRGMRITLELTKIVIGRDSVPSERTARPTLSAFQFSLRVEADSSVISEITEPVDVPEPDYLRPDETGNYIRSCSKRE